MKYWWVQHNLFEYEKHPDMIGRSAVPDENSNSEYKPLDRTICDIHRGDRIIYYAAPEDKVIVGVFRVVSNCKLILNDKSWGDVFALKIVSEKGYLARPPYYVYYYDMKRDLKNQSTLRDFFSQPVHRRGEVAVPLKKEQFVKICDYVKKYIEKGKDVSPDYITPKSKRIPNEMDIGKERSLGIIDYEPTSEQGVVALFIYHLNKLGFSKIKFIRGKFPDACALDKDGKPKYIEFKLYSSDYVTEYLRNPKYNKYTCDYVVCWEHDCKTIENDVEIIELSKVL